MSVERNGVILLGPGRLSYPHLLKPQETENGPRYNTSLLLPPTYDFTLLKDRLKAAWIKKFGEDKAKWPKGDLVRTPDKVIKKAEECYRAADGSRLYGPEFDGWFVISASTSGDDAGPEIVDAMKQPVTSSREVYPGRWARISVRPYGYANKTRGVTLGLGNVQLLRHDTPLGGRTTAASDFDEVAEEMDADDGAWD
ncbi:ssDNA-binding protein [Enterovirga aerilata]|uniref:DUF2815 family protein n=1 Tax=Enterovirga aerilata TaxID=2730920 RepID=A0A849IBX8_9HYPH|nr:ssDNA-binding protein [Enterovirga sp. DB1703]NNM74781.1 DUF2815 family protein [Enterovirga sp. DB1703]